VKFEDLCNIPASTVTTSKKALQSSNLTLPADVHYDAKMLTQLFTKPKWRISLNKRHKGEDGFVNSVAGGKWFEYQNPNDINNFIPPSENDNDDGGFNPDAFDDSEPENYMIEAPALGENMELVEEPKKVEQIKINYAKSAKVVDVKALKNSIWEDLCATNNVTKSKSAKGNNLTMEKPKSFQDILYNIPNLVSSETLQNISVPYCFICLLHLANEKSLVLEQPKNSSLAELIVRTQQM